MVLAHAKYVKAIAYAKVKTDKVDSHTLAQLLRMNFIPVAYKISNDKRLLHDALVPVFSCPAPLPLQTYELLC
ncbi:MAG: hypothetical protein U5J96_01580 [Ignavibacteriaceae bacterium]|nr:hypothetical protein [Ignavibacteriaceae bacterium]